MKSDQLYKERREAPDSLLFITEKKNGDTKARKVAYGSK